MSDEDYFKLYPQMKGVPLDVRPLSPEEVNARYYRRKALSRVPDYEPEHTLGLDGHNTWGGVPPDPESCRCQSEWDHRDARWEYEGDSESVQAVYGKTILRGEK